MSAVSLRCFLLRFVAFLYPQVMRSDDHANCITARTGPSAVLGLEKQTIAPPQFRGIGSSCSAPAYAVSLNSCRARYGTSGATPAILLSHSFRTSLLVIISPITVAPVPCLLTRVIPRHFLRGRVEPFAAAFVFAILFFVLVSAIDGCIIA